MQFYKIAFCLLLSLQINCLFAQKIATDSLTTDSLIMDTLPLDSLQMDSLAMDTIPILDSIVVIPPLDFAPIETALGVVLPDDYKAFMDTCRLDSSCYASYRSSEWHFWEDSTFVVPTLELRNAKVIGIADVAIAENGADGYLIYQANPSQQLSNKVFTYQKGEGIIDSALLLAEVLYAALTAELIATIEKGGFEQHDISPIMDCVTHLFAYASALRTTEYHTRLAKARNDKSLELFILLHEKGHPLAAHEVADNYFYAAETDIDKVIEWRRKAIDNGNTSDIYELADFIVDNKLELIDEAIKWLEYGIKNDLRREESLLELSRIYMQDIGGKQDFSRGIQYAQLCAALENEHAMADLGYYYWTGAGVEKDIDKAYELMKKANDISRAEWGGVGNWEVHIEALEKEIAKQKKKEELLEKQQRR